MQYSIDFETRSPLDLRRTGVYAYAEHPDTDVVCLAYAPTTGGAPVKLWLPSDPVPPEFQDPNVTYRAWNANFERVIYRTILVPRYDFPPARLDQYTCTMAEALALGLPASLAQAAQVLCIAEQKDSAGGRLIKKFSTPRNSAPPWVWAHEDEQEQEDLRAFYAYCKQDVRTERAIAQKIVRLSGREHRIYLVDQKINDRGIRIDLPFVRAAARNADQVQDMLHAELARITDNAVTKASQVTRLGVWCRAKGVRLPDMTRDTLVEALAGSQLPPDVERACRIRLAYGRTSVRKYAAALEAVGRDGRIRGLLRYHVASTGRWAGALVQPQNFPRQPSTPSEPPAEVRARVVNGQLVSLNTLAGLLRQMFIPAEGCRFLGGDYSQIEARVLGWLAQQPFGDQEYEAMAAACFNIPLDWVTTDQRHVGKIITLGCGYGMGADKLRRQLLKSDIHVGPPQAKHYIDTYRDRKHRIVGFWTALERAAFSALRNPNTVCRVHIGEEGTDPIVYFCDQQFLRCYLPSGRVMMYPDPAIRPRMTPWGEIKPAVTYMTRDSQTRRWTRSSTYGGKLTENVVQAIARDILADAIVRLEAAGHRVILTVHDEVLVEAPLKRQRDLRDLRDLHNLHDFRRILTEPVPWAPGLEIHAETWEGARWKK